MNKLKYHIIQLTKQTTAEEYGKALSLLNELEGIIVNQPNPTENKAFISYAAAPFQATLTLEQVEPTEKLKYTKLPKTRIILECDRTDFVTINLLRQVLINLEMRIYSEELNCLLPTEISLDDCTVHSHENHEKATKGASSTHFVAKAPYACRPC